MQDVVNGFRQFQRLTDIVLNETESRVALKMSNIGRCARDEVIHAHNVVPSTDQSIAEVRTDKPCPAGDEDLHYVTLSADRVVTVEANAGG